MDSISEGILRRLSTFHDILFINISDAYMNGDMVFDIEEDFYIPKLILQDKKFQELEKKTRKEILDKCTKKLAKYRISSVTIDMNKEITKKIIELLERHKNANIR